MTTNAAPPASATPVASRPRRLRRVLRTVLVVGLALVLALLAAIWRLGPRYDLYLVPPSPQAYVTAALDKMDAGYYASGPRWQAARRAAVEETKDAPDYAATLPALRKAVVVAGGKHSAVYDAGKDLAASDPDRPLPTVTRTGRSPRWSCRRCRRRTRHSSSSTHARWPTRSPRGCPRAATSSTCVTTTAATWAR